MTNTKLTEWVQFLINRLHHLQGHPKKNPVEYKRIIEELEAIGINIEEISL